MAWVLAVFLLLLAGLSAPRMAAAQAPEAPTVVLVVRHAEKAQDDPRDPSLTEAGRLRAAALVEAARGAGVTAIYTSQFKRTRETAKPLAEALGAPVLTFPIAAPTFATYPKRLASAIRTRHPGETVVVVNHSNTVPLIVEALGGQPAGPISEEEYDDLYIVIIPAEGPVRTIHTRYGPPTD